MKSKIQQPNSWESCTACSGGFRPSDKWGGGGGEGGGGHPDPEISGEGGGHNKFFSALRASVWSKNKGGGGRAPLLDPPLACQQYLKSFKALLHDFVLGSFKRCCKYIE